MGRIVSVVIVVAMLCGMARAAEPLPSVQELQQLYDQHKYQPLLQKISRVMALQGESAKLYNRRDLLMLKGQAQLQLKMVTRAVDTFAEAVKEGGEARQVAEARTMELLVRRAKALKYTPRAAMEELNPPRALDILDEADRKLAIKGLFNDELAAAKAKLVALGQAKNMQSVLDIIDDIRDVRRLELAATDKDEHGKAMLGEVADRAQALMGDALRKADADLDRISKQANEKIKDDEPVLSEEARREKARRDKENLTNPNRPREPFRTVHRRGLTTADITAIGATTDLCRKIGPAVRELGEALETEAGRFASLVADAERVQRHAEEVLSRDYSGSQVR